MFEPSIRTHSALSWILLAEILQQIDGEYLLARLHPGGGQYDCLSLVSLEGRPVVMANRKGWSINIRGEIFSDFWERVILDPRAAATYLVRECELPARPVGEETSLVVRSMMAIGNCLWAHKHEQVEVLWGWSDSEWGDDAATFGVDDFDLPSNWKQFSAPIQGMDWRAWVWLMKIENVFVYAFNSKSGELHEMPSDSVIRLRPTEPDASGSVLPLMGFRVTAKNQSQNSMSIVVQPSELRSMVRYFDHYGSDVVPLSSLKDAHPELLERVKFDNPSQEVGEQ